MSDKDKDKGTGVTEFTIPTYRGDSVENLRGIAKRLKNVPSSAPMFMVAHTLEGYAEQLKIIAAELEKQTAELKELKYRERLHSTAYRDVVRHEGELLDLVASLRAELKKVNP